jgi:hypothetical protein
MSIELRFNDLRSTVERPRSDPDVLLGITADLSILVDEELIFSEPDFPLVELACQLGKWVHSPGAGRGDFQLDSMESDVRGIVKIEAAGDGWRIGSEYEGRSGPAKSLEEVTLAIRAFLDQLVLRCQAELGVDVRSWLE